MSEREEMIKWLTGSSLDFPGKVPPGLSLEEAERRLLDDDLWILHPEFRYAAKTPEEALEQWRWVVSVMDRVADFFVHEVCFNESAVNLVLDAEERGKEALRRAQKRLQEGEE